MEDYIISKEMLNANQSDAGSLHNLPSQGMLSRSHSRLQSTVQKIDSHIRSTSPFLHNISDKKYLDVQIHNYFLDNKVEGHQYLIQLLREQFEDKVKINHFKEHKELLQNNYHDHELHYLIVPHFDVDWASTFAKQER